MRNIPLQYCHSAMDVYHIGFELRSFVIICQDKKKKGKKDKKTAAVRKAKQKAKAKSSCAKRKAKAAEATSPTKKLLMKKPPKLKLKTTKAIMHEHISVVNFCVEPNS